MLRIIFAIMLIGHGLAHISGFSIAWTKSQEGFQLVNPWIFSQNVLIKSGVGKLFGILWLVALLSFLAAGLSIFFHWFDWKILATAGAIISILVILPWWNTVPVGAKIGLAFNVFIFILVYYIKPAF